MKKFSMTLFFKNLKYLCQYNIKKMNRLSEKSAESVSFEQLNKGMDNLVYELPFMTPPPLPKIKNYEETVDELIKTDKSIIRFGDGELFLISGRSIGFQAANPLLCKRLSEIFNVDDERIMIGINYYYWYASLSNFHEYPKFVYRTFISDIRQMAETMISYDKQYYSAGFTNMYTTFKHYNFSAFFEKIKNIFANKCVTIVCGSHVFNDIKFNIFDCCKSVDYILCPSQNAIDCYDEILKKSKQIPKENIVIVILGPTGKILAYDLIKSGYRVLDLGHLAKDYDAFMKQIPMTQQNIGKFFEN